MFHTKILLYLIIISFINSCSNAFIPHPTFTRIIENVPFYAQPENQCGPATLAAVLNYYGAAVTRDEIATEIFSKSAKGTLDLDMLIYARKKGLAAEQYPGSIDDIKAKIDIRKPLIVLVDLGSSFYTQNHFMVVTGYSDNGIIVNSGDLQGQFIPLERFTRIWQKTNYWTLLITSKN